MLSIIISSYQENYYSTLEKNIRETIGLPYEIIKIDNPGKIGICEAYNNGASRAKYDYLLFIHEDIIFHTYNWGELLINHLSKENIGVVGVAGSSYVPKAPISWNVPDDNYVFLNLIQNTKERNNSKLYSNINDSAKVFALDGVFLAIKKSVYNKFLFDEVVKGFHGYDTDFSLRVATEYDNYVISNILIEHFSKGNPDKNFFDNNIQIRRKIKNNFNKTFEENIEKCSFQIFIEKYFRYYKFNFKNIIFTLKFLPLNLRFKSYISIIKSYLYYFLKENTSYKLNS